MATYTDNLHLEKPAQSDLYNISVFNGNADIIDSAMAARALAQNQATIEASSTASRNYAKGDFLVRNGLLYKVTSAIASGGTITPGTNCVATNTGAELKALNDSLANLSYRTQGVNLTSGTSTVTLNSSTYFIIGNLVCVSARTTFNSTSSNAISLPLVSMPRAPYMPTSIYCVSSTTMINGSSFNTWHNVMSIENHSGTYYAHERVTNNISQGTQLDFLLLYPIT